MFMKIGDRSGGTLRRVARGVCFTLLATVAAAAEFYVAPDGRDTNPGTIGAPFGSVQRAQQDVGPGDTVFIRGGTYVMSEAQIAGTDGLYACVVLLEHSGRPGRPIQYWAYPGERPVFDFSHVKPAGKRVTAFRVNGSWLHLKGLEVVGVQVTIKTHTQSICFDNRGSHNIYQQLSMHDGMAIGLWIGGAASDNLVLNCDAYRNHDTVSEDGLGGNVDGFGYHGRKGSVNNVFRGCRAWFNSDDGFDFIHTDEAATIEDCWAFYNGYSPEFEDLANGTGFKAGGFARTPLDKLPNPIPRHVVRRCLAVRNKANGFYANHHLGGLDFVHNTGFRNRVNFNLLGRDPADNVTQIPGRGHRLKNNLGFAARDQEVAQLDAEASEVSGNYFTLPVSITAEDFLSLDEAELVRPRQPNGDLPVLQFLHLAPTSEAIDRGIMLGEVFTGAAPDLGAFESEPSGPRT